MSETTRLVSQAPIEAQEFERALVLGIVPSYLLEGFSSVLWDPAIPEDEQAYDDLDRNHEALKVAIARGEMPLLPNGFKFVFDVPLEIEGRGPIPPDRYAGYWHLGECPLAPPGHYMFNHDVRHIPGYRQIVARRPLANLIRDAAGTSLRLKTCDLFADVMDAFSDAISDLGLPYQDHAMDDVWAARSELRRLVMLSAGVDFVAADTYLRLRDATPLERALWRMLGINEEHPRVRHARRRSLILLGR